MLVEKRATPEQLALVASFYQFAAIGLMTESDSTLATDLVVYMKKAVTDADRSASWETIDGKPVGPVSRAILRGALPQFIESILDADAERPFSDIIDLANQAQAALDAGAFSLRRERDVQQAA